ncbi:MAG: YhbY family RNA-binding protein [Thermoanaerobacteraceae bacterium]|nr:YhbY family RNA-binding protein [Thermoanaerobacteraceae bacterium]
MITSKQRAMLRSMANGIKPVVNIGKDGIDETVLSSIDKALEARELIKINVLENAPISSRDAIRYIADELKAEPVQVIGKKFVIYRRSTKKPGIEI